MLVGLAAFSSSGLAMLLFYLVAYMFGNMGAFLVIAVWIPVRPDLDAGHGRLGQTNSVED
jgi:NADH:ubiquinone oxidoreductase subunit 2 (subunit N)